VTHRILYLGLKFGCRDFKTLWDENRVIAKPMFAMLLSGNAPRPDTRETYLAIRAN
jgi:hypothetical protein